MAFAVGGLAAQADAPAAHGLRLRFQQDRQHEFRPTVHRRNRAVAGVFEHLHRLVAQIRLFGGQNGKGLEAHSAYSDAVFGQPGTHQRQQTKALRTRERIVRGGNDDIAASLPFFHWQLGGNFRQNVAKNGQNAGFAAADEPGEFGGAAMIERIAGAKLANQLADRGFARLREEVLRGGSGIGRFPASGRDQALVHARIAVEANPLSAFPVRRGCCHAHRSRP